MKSLLVKLGIVLIGLIVSTYAEVWGADWALLEKVEATKFYYDEKDITHSPQKIAKVWITQIYTENDKGILLNLVGRRYENLSYSINSLELVCGAKLTRFLTKTYFSENGDLLGLEDPPDKWERRQNRVTFRWLLAGRRRNYVGS